MLFRFLYSTLFYSYALSLLATMEINSQLNCNIFYLFTYGILVVSLTDLVLLVKNAHMVSLTNAH